MYNVQKEIISSKGIEIYIHCCKIGIQSTICLSIAKILQNNRLKHSTNLSLLKTTEIKKLWDESRVKRDSNGRFAKKGSLRNLPIIESEHSIEDDMLAANPNFDSEIEDFWGNCGNSVLAYELRRRGYDVEAIGNKFGMTRSSIYKIFGIWTEFNDTVAISRLLAVPMRVKDFEELLDVVNDWSDGSRGMIDYKYFPFRDIPDSIFKNFSINHIMSVEKRDSEIIFIDPQTNEKNFDILKHSTTTSIHILRTDNREISDNVLQYIQSSRRKFE